MTGFEWFFAGWCSGILAMVIAQAIDSCRGLRRKPH